MTRFSSSGRRSYALKHHFPSNELIRNPLILPVLSLIIHLRHIRLLELPSRYPPLEEDVEFPKGPRFTLG